MRPDAGARGVKILMARGTSGRAPASSRSVPPTSIDSNSIMGSGPTPTVPIADRDRGRCGASQTACLGHTSLSTTRAGGWGPRWAHAAPPIHPRRDTDVDALSVPAHPFAALILLSAGRASSSAARASEIIRSPAVDVTAPRIPPCRSRRGRIAARGYPGHPGGSSPWVRH